MKKKIFLSILIVILSFTMISVYADEGDTQDSNQDALDQLQEINENNSFIKTETKDRSSLSNLGVNKKWKITDNNRDNVLRTKYVNADEKIYDFSGVIKKSEYEDLRKKALEFKEKTNMEIIILIDDLPYTSDSENEDYASDFYDYNDFGLDLDKNYSGVLLFRNTYEQDPYYNIYTFGEAQLYFSYNRLENTLDDIYNSLHNHLYYMGFNSFIDSMSNYYDSGIPSEMNGYTLDETGHLKRDLKSYKPPYFMATIIAFVTSLIIVLILIKKNKMVMKETRAEKYINKDDIKITNKQDNFISSHTTHYTVSSSSGSSGGGFSSSSGSSGGGHSSGGGRHG